MPKNSDHLLRDYYNSAGYSAGLIHAAAGSAQTGEILLVQSRDRLDTFNCLWSVAGPHQSPKLIFDHQTLDRRTKPGAPLSAAEAQARERLRKQTSGVDSLSLAADGLTVAFTAQSRLVLGQRATAQTNWKFNDTGLAAPYAPSLSPTGRHLAAMVGDNFSLFRINHHQLQPVPLSNCPPGLGRNDFVSAEEIGRQTTYTWSSSGLFIAAILTDSSEVPAAHSLTGQAPRFAPSELRYAFAGAANAKQTIYWIDTITGSCARLPVPARFDGEYLITIDFCGDELRSVWQDTTQKQVAGFAWRKRRWVELFRVSDTAWVPVSEGKYLLDQPEPLWLDESGQYAVIRQADRCFSLSEQSPLRLIGVWDGAVLAIVLKADRSTAIISWNPVTNEHTVLSSQCERAYAWPAGQGLVLLTKSYGTNQSIIRRPMLPDQELVVSQPPRIRRPAVFQPSLAINVAVKLPSGAGPFPVILNTYAGPQASVTAQLSANYAVDEWLCRQGFAVVAVDGRGSMLANRDWERQLLGQIDDCVMADQLAGLEQAFQRYPQLDRERVGVRGWSFGGYFALLCAARRADMFQAAVAGAPVTNWEWYDTHYTERYFGGTPLDKPKAYTRASLLTAPAAPQIPTLLLHGLADDNVLAANSLAYLATHQSDYVTFVPLMATTHMATGTDLRLALAHRELEFLVKHLQA